MSTVETVLWQYVREIEPTPTQKEGAQRSHTYLRELLATGQMASRWTNSYLSGSYARDTAIRPIDDVDIVFEIQPEAWASSARLLSSLPNAADILETFARAIRYRYPVSSVYGQRRSVRLQLNHLDIDVVPAIPDSRDRLTVLVPDRDTGDWIRSAPRRHSEIATLVNTKHAGRFKPLVKLLKFWNSHLPEAVRAKSFLLETAGIRLFDAVSLNTLEDGLVFFWDFLTSRYGEPCLYRWQSDYGMSFGSFGVTIPDAAGTGSNTAARMTDQQARALAGKARISRDRLVAAKNARTMATQQIHIQEAFRA